MTPVKTCRLLLVTFILARTAIAEQIPDHEPGGRVEHRTAYWQRRWQLIKMFVADLHDFPRK